MSANIYVIGNFKGGVGKSTVAQMLGFESATVKKRRTLIIDLDMQGNTSDVMNLTHMNYNDGHLYDYDVTINDILMFDKPLDEGIYNIIDNLDIIPADISFEMYQDWIKEKYNRPIDQFKYMKEKLSPLFDRYDSIYVDVPPSISIYSKSAMYLADYAIIVLQTQVKSMKNAEQYIEYMEYFSEEYDHPMSIVGVIPFMLETGDSIDRDMYRQAQEMYGKHLLKNVVLKNGRLKRYDGTGITTELTKYGKMKQWDAKAHKLFTNILEELDEHQQWFE